ncbi:CPBP family intramembrane glutamic endopeptidase [Paludifilum halophilum]|uniref:CAAX prenyl protease 2/Lysostaphin resistance protein A-like domain-containing protein n=1 Tax=Paludifilum halophilum TaxID=1642702 RepID=A0A235B2W8_9BACL|nr:CPBP family intramembrane glutamic endopeptidase [Paludifilum halophilum]OYD06309.1 hypothetical protein CHM34_17265 [Paludifilum halophilum]
MSLPHLSQSSPSHREKPFSHILRHLSAWLLCISFFYMIPMEFASLEWEKTSEGLWRVSNGDGTGSLFLLQYLLWMLVTLFAASLFFITGLISGFAEERYHNQGLLSGRDLVYYFSWVQFLTLAFLLPYYAIVPETEAEGGSGGWFGLIAPYIPHILMLGVALWIFRRRLPDLGFRQAKGKKWMWMIGAVGVLYLLLFFFLDALVTLPVAEFFNLELQSWREDSISQGIFQATRMGWISVLGQIALLGLIGPIAEEIVFRGLLMRGMMQKIGTTAGVILSALIFALFHTDIPFLAPLFIMGLILGGLYAVFRNLWAPILFHVVNNTVSVVVDVISKH